MVCARLVLVGAVSEDEDLGRGVEPEGVVVLPVDGELGRRQRAEVRLGERASGEAFPCELQPTRPP